MTIQWLIRKSDELILPLFSMYRTQSCLSLNKLPLNIEMADCCLLFDDAIRSDIQNDIVYSVCCKELICLFEDCFNEM